MKHRFEIIVDVSDNEGDALISMTAPDVSVGAAYHAAKFLLKAVITSAPKLGDPIEVRFFMGAVMGCDLVMAGAEAKMEREKAARDASARPPESRP